jgi:transaldolase
MLSASKTPAGDSMKFFIDSADLKELQDLARTGLVDGVTTNPSLIAKSGRDMLAVIREICALVPGPVSAEVTATDHPTMLAEGRKLAALAANVAVKVPLTPDGLKTCRALADEGTPVNVTLCFSAAQAILAAKAGAAYVSPFVGRLDDVGTDGMQLIADICQIYRAYPAIRTEVLVASVRHPIHVVAAAKLGAHVATLPPGVLRQMYQHPLTDKGLAAFLADWQKTGQSILG